MEKALICIAGFLAPPAGSNFWGAINSPIAVALVAAVFAWLLKDRVQEIVQDVAQSRALEDQQDSDLQKLEPSSEPQVEEAVGPTVQFERPAAIIDNFKAFVDRKATEALDGRNRRKYNNFQRYDYVPLIKALIADRNLDDELGSPPIQNGQRVRLAGLRFPPS